MITAEPIGLFYFSQTVSTFLLSFKLVKTQYHAQVKVMRTDNGTKFVNHDCQTLLAQQGIMHQKSCVYTPQQNGVVERKHLILTTNC